jgi:hypothetical protein
MHPFATDITKEIDMDDLFGGLNVGDRVRITGVPNGEGEPLTLDYTFEGYEPPKKGETEFRIYLAPRED